ncbi:PREDICTED: uncharacterized protein At5g41620-like isoform X3 [Ipomoea nil]|uniref:uncharacterized protein At5g41620-like isoform X3 n=1 Tax=Ipomoea nil TaxID=35883 RepID=UPI000900CAD8|nr:PREDICTED: uncharacterized protein At5g41620-like isoform X3 [Ipomoea nil]
MERGGKGEERRWKKQEESLGVKLKRGVLVGKRGGNCTPSPTWKYGLAQTDGSLLQDYTFPSKSNSTSLSVRKLGANLWEVQPLPRLKMNKDKGFQLPTHLPQPLDPPSQQPAGDSRGHVASLRKQHNNQSVAENDDAILCESPASCSSSMEMAPYRPAVLPAKMDMKGRSGKSSYSLKTSTELLKVLNRIWSLEEQHASHILLVKALKRELDHSKMRIKELQQEKKMNRLEINGLMNRVAEDRQIEEAVKALRDELEDERKLRKHSENLQRKLGREVSEVKSSFSSALRELERERKARAMLEDLCDEFAKEVKEYEKEVRALKCKPRRDQRLGEHSDKLILHISEAWLDERMQMKAVHDNSDKKTISGRLGFEIEEFLRAKQSAGNCRHSLESFHLEEDGSAPRNENVEGESFDGTLHKQENGKCTSRIHLEEITEPNPTIKRSQSQELPKTREEVPSKDPVEVKDAKDLENTTSMQVRSQKRKSKQLHIRGSLLNSLIRNQLSRGRKQHEAEEKRAEQLPFDPSTFTGPEKTGPESAVPPEPSAKLQQGAKENTLKAKLLEARLESQQHHHSRASEGS